jgi:hypothetical protein
MEATFFDPGMEITTQAVKGELFDGVLHEQPALQPKPLTFGETENEHVLYRRCFCLGGNLAEIGRRFKDLAGA